MMKRPRSLSPPLFTVLLLCTTALAAFGENPTLRVASVQMEVSNQISANLERILRGIDEAAQAGARVVLFPETALSGFDKQTIAELDWTALDGAMAKISEAARSNQIYVLYGTATRSGVEKPFNSAIVVGPDGNEVFRYHKSVPERWFEPGDRLALFEIDGIPCTLIICHDNRYPELVRIPVLAGAQICFYLSYEINGLASALGKMENYRSQLIARAAENGIYVLQSNGIGGVPGSESDALVLGYSRFVGPDGSVIAEAPGLMDAMLVEDIDPARAKRGNALNSPKIRALENWWKQGLAVLDHKPAPVAVKSASSTKQNQVRIGLMRGVPEKWNLEKNFAVFKDQFQKAVAQDVDIFLTPECWLDGYAAPDKASTPEKLRGIAQELDDSEYLAEVSRLAAEHGVHICFGFSSLESGEIFNTAGLWNDRGERIGVYHKTHLQTHDLQYSFGESLPVWDTKFGPLGILICADRRWPESARVLRIQGARLILNPTYGMCHLKNEWWMRTRSFENQCFIAFTHPEVSLVTNPKGDIAGKAEGPDPDLLICDIDLAESKDNNHIADRRPDLYGLLSAPLESLPNLELE